MRRLDRYVTREFLGPFLAAITAFIVISLSVQLYWLAEMVVVKRTPLVTVLRLVLFNLPAAIVQVLPFATLFGVLLGISRLSRDSELSIMRAAGLKLSRIALPLVVISLLISAFGFYLGDQVAPKANLEARNIVNRMILGDAAPSIDDNVFFRGPDNKFFYIGRITEDRATVLDVMIYDIGYGKYPQLITAAKGRADSGVWTFENGNIHECGPDGRVVSTAHFDAMEIRMERAVTDYTNSGRTTSEMSMKQLKESLDLFMKSGIRAKSLLIDYHLKMAQPLSSLIFAILAMPLAIRSPRKGGAVFSIGAGIAIITFYFLFESVVRSYGMLQVTRIEPWLAAWLADILFMVAAVLMMMKADAKRTRRRNSKRAKNGKPPGAVILCLAALILLGVGARAAATGTSVKVTATRLVFEGGDIWRAEGSVTVSFDDVTITADSAAIDLKTGIAELTGMVKVRTKDSEVEAVSATCNIKTRQISFQTFEGKITDKRVKGYIYIAGERFTKEDDNYKLSGGYITTCDLPQPHYRIEAESIEFTDQDYIIARNVSYFEANIRLIRLPFLSIPLREEDRMLLPEFGWSSYEGVYIKTTIKRNLPEGNKLALRLDVFQKAGLGVGLRHDYAFEDIGTGYYSIYGVKNLVNSIASWQAEVFQSVKLPLEIVGSARYQVKGGTDIAGSSFDEQYMELRLSRDAKTDKTAATFSYKFRNDIIDTEALSITASHTSEPVEGLKLAGNISWRKVAQNSVVTQEQLTYKASVSYSGKLGKVTLAAQAADTMDEKQQVVLSSLKRLPEFQAELFKLKLWELPLGLTGRFTAGRYIERVLNVSPPEYLDAGKVEAELGLSLDRLDLWGYGSFDIGLTAAVTGYTTDDWRAYLGGSTALIVKPVKGWDVKVSYDYYKKLGQSPFRFDSLQEKNRIAASTTASFYGVTLSASTGYDFLKAAFEGFSTSAGYKYSDKYQADIIARFALPTFKLSSLIGRVSLKPIPELTLKFGLEYSGSLGKLSKVETSGGVTLFKEWKVVWAVIYDLARDGWRKADFSITKDMHCREFTVGYQVMEQRFFMNLKFKAFPDANLGIGTGDFTLFN